MAIATHSPATFPPQAPMHMNYISLNNSMGYIPPCPPPLVPCDMANNFFFPPLPTVTTKPCSDVLSRVPPCTPPLASSSESPFLKSGIPTISTSNMDESNSDIPARLLVNLKLKRKTPTPELSSEETSNVKNWFSPVGISSASTSSRKHPHASVADSVGQVTSMSKTMF
ncbi:hypothetical protein J3R83DRAFT_9905 [Lanmaoa asiatica]|nr:hypothetical protein J3R83DRAFT_9905 [Lanmaoa asiatica]